jgi:hypothetical protein
MTTQMNEMKELMLANSKWEALYRTALNELSEADKVIVRLSLRIQDLTERELFQTEELKQTKNMLSEIKSAAAASDQGPPVFPVRETNRVDDDFMMRHSVDLFGNIVYRNEFEEEILDTDALDNCPSEFPVRQTNHRSSVNIVNQTDFDDTPEWVNDRTSLWQMPLAVNELEAIGKAQEKYYDQMSRDDELEAIGKAQEKYYAQQDPLETIKKYTTPPSTPRVNRIPPPPVLKRGSNRMCESELSPNVTVRRPRFAAIHPTPCTCFECNCTK